MNADAIERGRDRGDTSDNAEAFVGPERFECEGAVFAAAPGEHDGNGARYHESTMITRAISPSHGCADFRQVMITVPHRVIFEYELRGERRIGVQRDRRRAIELRVAELADGRRRGRTVGA